MKKIDLVSLVSSVALATCLSCNLKESEPIDFGSYVQCGLRGKVTEREFKEVRGDSITLFKMNTIHGNLSWGTHCVERKIRVGDSVLVWFRLSPENIYQESNIVNLEHYPYFYIDSKKWLEANSYTRTFDGSI